MNKIQSIILAGMALTAMGISSIGLASSQCNDELSQKTAGCLNKSEMTTFAKNYQTYLGGSNSGPSPVSAPAPQPNNAYQSNTYSNQQSTTTDNNATPSKKSTIHWF